MAYFLSYIHSLTLTQRPTVKKEIMWEFFSFLLSISFRSWKNVFIVKISRYVLNYFFGWGTEWAYTAGNQRGFFLPPYIVTRMLSTLGMLGCLSKLPLVWHVLVLVFVIGLPNASTCLVMCVHQYMFINWFIYFGLLELCTYWVTDFFDNYPLTLQLFIDASDSSKCTFPISPTFPSFQAVACYTTSVCLAQSVLDKHSQLSHLLHGLLLTGSCSCAACQVRASCSRWARYRCNLLTHLLQVFSCLICQVRASCSRWARCLFVKMSCVKSYALPTFPTFPSSPLFVLL